MKRIILLLPMLVLLAACNRATQETPVTPTRPAAAASPAAVALVTATLPLSTPIGGGALATAAPATTVTAVGTASIVATAALPVGMPTGAGAVRPLTTAVLPVGTPSALATGALSAAALGTPGTPASSQALPRATAGLPVAPPAAGATGVVTPIPLLPAGTPSPTSAVVTLAPQPLVGTPAPTSPAYPAPTSSSASTPPAGADVTRYNATDAGISFDVPVGWQRQPGAGWLFAPAGLTSPQLGVKWAAMGPGWQPTSMLPSGANVLTMGSLSVPLGNATVFILPGAGAGSVAQAGETHVVVQAAGGRAYDFYGTANRVEDLLALQPALLQMVGSAAASR